MRHTEQIHISLTGQKDGSSPDSFSNTKIEDEIAVHGYKNYYSSCSSVKSEQWTIKWQLWDKLYLVYYNWLKMTEKEALPKICHSHRKSAAGWKIQSHSPENKLHWCSIMSHHCDANQHRYEREWKKPWQPRINDSPIPFLTHQSDYLSYTAPLVKWS